MKNKSRLKAVARQTGSFNASGNELMLYGVIGSYWDDLEGQQVVRKINEMSGDITVRLNSPGGDVFDGIAIMNALKAYKGKVTVIVEALAASIASVIAMAGDEIIMSEGSFLMIHNPWMLAMGDAKELRHQAGILDQITETLVGIYSRKTGKTSEALKALLDAETWLSASSAVDDGFADRQDGTETELEVSNFDLSVFNNVPSQLKIAAKATKPASIRDMEKLLRSAGFSQSEAKAVASKGFAALTQRDDEKDFDSGTLLAAIENRNNQFKMGATK